MTQMTTNLATFVLLVVLSALPALAAQPGIRETLPGAAARLPIGVFAVHRDLLYLAKMKGFEVVHNYLFEESRDKNDELAAYLDEAHHLGLKVMAGFERKENYSVPKVLERVRRFRDHPALWAWYLYDEPHLEMRDRVAESAAAIRQEDSRHPLTIAPAVTVFASLADISFAYTYPVKDQPFPSQDLGSCMRRMDHFAAAGNPFCILVQTFNWNHYLQFDKKRRHNRHPTPEEMRFLAFYGVMKGARGVFFFSFQTLPIEFDNLRQVAALVGELKGMREYLAGEQVDPKTYTHHPHAAAWRRDGHTLLIICNPEPQKKEAVMLSGPWSLRDQKHSDRLVPSGQLALNPWDVRLIIVRDK